ncbi:MAG: archease [Thermoprotei archaeon]|nr:MAG: archease [Thermoprotei archaeon]RLE98386.1 MAG: archease [Thermoprotei archaeon]
MGGGFRHLPHTADVLIEAWGDTLEEAFEYAALGVFEVMTDTSRVEAREERRIKAEGHDLEALLYDWIEQLLYYFDAEQLLFSKFRVERITPMASGSYTLVASAWGEPYDPSRHESRTLVKAMTYHMMEIRRVDNKVRLRFVVDI